MIWLFIKGPEDQCLLLDRPSCFPWIHGVSFTLQTLQNGDSSCKNKLFHRQVLVLWYSLFQFKEPHRHVVKWAGKHLAEAPFYKVFNSHLCKMFSCIPRGAGDVKSRCVQKSWWQPNNPLVDTNVEEDNQWRPFGRGWPRDLQKQQPGTGWPALRPDRDVGGLVHEGQMKHKKDMWFGAPLDVIQALYQGSGTYGSRAIYGFSGDGIWLPDNFELEKKIKIRPPPCNIFYSARLQQK